MFIYIYLHKSVTERFQDHLKVERDTIACLIPIGMALRKYGNEEKYQELNVFTVVANKCSIQRDLEATQYKFNRLSNSPIRLK